MASGTGIRLASSPEVYYTSADVLKLADKQDLGVSVYVSFGIHNWFKCDYFTVNLYQLRLCLRISFKFAYSNMYQAALLVYYLSMAFTDGLE